MYACGLRISEAASLETGAVDASIGSPDWMAESHSALLRKRCSTPVAGSKSRAGKNVVRLVTAKNRFARPSQVSLVFDRRVGRRPPGRFRTRVITDGVVPA